MFSALTAKIMAGVSLVLLVGLIVTGLQLRSAKATIERQRNDMAQCEAARAVQNAAVERLRQEGEQQRRAFADALERGNQAILEAQGRVRIVRQTAPNGCATPEQVMGAGL